MKRLLTAVALLLSLGVSAQEFPSAQQVVDKFIDARGGKAAMEAVEDLTMSLTTNTLRGVTETEVKYKKPNKLSMVIYANAFEVMSMVYDGTSFKRTMRMGGDNPVKTGEEAKKEASMMHPFAELFYKELGVEGIVEGKEKVGDKEAYKVAFKLGDRTWTDFFDITTGYKIKTIATNKTPRGVMESVVTYDDYKSFKGSEVKFAAKRTQTNQMMGDMTSEMSNVKFNKGLKDKEFEVK